MVYIFLVLIIILIDQITKNYFERSIKENEFKEVIKDKFYFSNVRNKGAFYGLFKNNPIILKILSIFSLIFVGYIFLKSLKGNTIRAVKLGYAFVFGGAIGNILDRFRRKYVVDFLYIKYKKMPIFNIADIFVFVGSILLLIISLFSKDS